MTEATQAPPTVNGLAPSFTRILGHIFSLETAFALFIYAGIFKSGLPKNALPFDFTLIFASICVLGAAVLLATKSVAPDRFRVTAAAWMTLFFLYVNVSQGWSANPGLAWQRVTLSLPLCLAAFLICTLVISTDRLRVQRYFGAVLGITAFIGFGSLALVARGPLEAGLALSTEGAADYIARGLTLVVALAYIMGLLMCSRRGVSQGLYLITIPLILLLILVTGSRQALVGGALVILLPVLIDIFVPIDRFERRQARFGKFVVLAVASTLVVAGALVARPDALTTISRVEFLQSEDPEATESAMIRPALRKAAWEDWSESPVFGKGLSSFSKLHGLTSRDHPHNLILELLAETGAVGFALFATAIVFLFHRTKSPIQMLSDPAAIAVGLSVLVLLTSAMVSTSWTENRALFAMLGLVPFLSRRVTV